jgi:endonuclease/exonuclease/phosphatase family metal-dependent hydrolase
MVNFLYTWIIFFSCLVNWSAVGLDGSSQPSGGKPTFKIMSYNIRNGVGLDKITDYNRIASVIRRIDADVVALQELDSATARSKGVVVLNELAERTKLFATYSASIDFQGGKYGVGMLTREKPVSWKKLALPGREEKRSLLIVELKAYVICCTHFSLTAEDRLSSIELMEEATKGYSKPVFLAGDLNAEPGSEALIRLCTNWSLLSNPKELSFPADLPKRCIDYILVRNDQQKRVRLLETSVEKEPVASDHRPVWVQFSLQ